MRKQGSSSGTYIVLGLIGAVFAAWLALMIAPSVSGGLAQIVTDLPAITANPLNIRWCGDSVGTLLVFLTAYALVVAMLVLNRKNYRYREEHGSAKWGNAQAVNRQFSRGKFEENKILTKHVSICLDGRKSRRNLNTMVVGGAGSGKTRFYAKPKLRIAKRQYL